MEALRLKIRCGSRSLPHLRQRQSQLVSRAKQPVFGGAFGYLEDVGHRAQPHSLKVLQLKNRTLPGRELLHCTGDGGLQLTVQDKSFRIATGPMIREIVEQVAPLP